MLMRSLSNAPAFLALRVWKSLLAHGERVNADSYSERHNWWNLVVGILKMSKIGRERKEGRTMTTRLSQSSARQWSCRQLSLLHQTHGKTTTATPVIQYTHPNRQSRPVNYLGWGALGLPVGEYRELSPHRAESTRYRIGTRVGYQSANISVHGRRYVVCRCNKQPGSDMHQHARFISLSAYLYCLPLSSVCIFLAK